MFLVVMVVAEGHGGERGKKKCLAEERKSSRWLTTEEVVVGRWSWQRLVVLVAQGGVGGRNGDSVGFLWRRKKEEETEKENLQWGEGGRLVFWITLDPIFSSLRLSTPPLFIGGGRG